LSHPKQLLDELNHLESLRDPSKTGNRQFKRFSIRGEAEMHPISRSRLDSTPIQIHLRDISRGGIGFVCQSCPDTNSSWRVCFLLHGYVVGGQATIIRHARPLGDGIFLVGGQFVLDSGLLSLLGVDPADIHDGDDIQDLGGDPKFVPPADA
jgi:hypothetical protein